MRLHQHVLAVLLCPAAATVTNLILNRVALDRVAVLRREMPAGRQLVIVGDGSFTNRTVMRGLPDDCTYIGRARKDCVLHHLPATLFAAA